MIKIIIAVIFIISIILLEFIIAKLFAEIAHDYIHNKGDKS